MVLVILVPPVFYLRHSDLVHSLSKVSFASICSAATLFRPVFSICGSISVVVSAEALNHPDWKIDNRQYCVAACSDCKSELSVEDFGRLRCGGCLFCCPAALMLGVRFHQMLRSCGELLVVVKCGNLNLSSEASLGRLELSSALELACK